MFTIELPHFIMYLVFLFTGVFIGVWIMNNLKNTSNSYKIYYDEEGNEVDIDKIISSHNSLIQSYNNIVEFTKELECELYFLNHCENCSNFNHKTGKCKKRHKHDIFCYYWCLDKDPSKLIHNWYDTDEMMNILQTKLSIKGDINNDSKKV